MRYARVQDGIVREINQFDEAPVMHPDLEWVQVADDVVEGWVRQPAGGFAPPPRLLDDATVDKRRAIDLAYLAAIAAGYTPATGPGAGKAFQLDQASQDMIGNLAQKAGYVLDGRDGVTWPSPVLGFIAADNTPVPFTPAEFIPFADGASNRVIAIRTNYRRLKDALLAAVATGVVGNVDSVDHQDGWD